MRKLPRLSLPRWRQQRDGAGCTACLVRDHNACHALPLSVLLHSAVHISSPTTPSRWYAELLLRKYGGDLRRATTAAARRQGRDTVLVRHRTNAVHLQHARLAVLSQRHPLPLSYVQELGTAAAALARKQSRRGHCALLQCTPWHGCGRRHMCHSGSALPVASHLLPLLVGACHRSASARRAQHKCGARHTAGTRQPDGPPRGVSPLARIMDHTVVHTAASCSLSL